MSGVAFGAKQVEHWPEFVDLQDKAFAYLNGTTAVPIAANLPAARLLLRVWHYPAFGIYRSWSLFKLRAPSGALLLRRIAWNRPADYARLTQPLEGLRNGFHTDPTIEVRDRPLEYLEIQDSLSAGATLNVPLLTLDRSVAIDGETLGIHQPGRITLEWNTTAPTPEIEMFIRQLIERYESI